GKGDGCQKGALQNGKGEAGAVGRKRKIKGGMGEQLKKSVGIRYRFIIGGIPLVLKKGRFF
ncbi:hypothetical protein E4V51_23965, partial [Paenibacillus sp. 28ISP30-2]|nr:hypothetical protein [Paenibacillus sp. 28ISP30-2]